MSTIRNRNRLMGTPVVLVNVRRTSYVPKVEFWEGTEVKSRTTFGGSWRRSHVSSLDAVRAKPSREVGEVRFSGPGAPSRCPAPALVPLVSTKTKSAALSLLSCTCAVVGPGVVWISDRLLQFPLPPPAEPVQPAGILRVKE